MKHLTLLLFFVFTTVLCFGQEKQAITDKDYSNNTVEMADSFRADGKIYVVVAIVLTILIGLFIYLILIDRKVTRLENELSKSDN